METAVEAPLSRKCFAEALGTFCLLFAGAGAIIINDVSGGAVTHMGIAISFGLIVLAMIYSIGDISGAHINPAVTMGFVAAGRFPLSQAGPYILCQLAGALLACYCLKFLFPGHETLGMTQPSDTVAQAFAFEFLLSFMLMLVILSVSTGAKEKGITAGIAIGSFVALAALFAGPVGGASMNPARSFGPALAAGDLEHLWIYFVATTQGAITAVPACRCVREASCCGAPQLNPQE